MDAAFIWQTNIGEIARDIDQGLAKINAAIQQASTGMGGDLGAQLGAGVEGNLRRITQRLQVEMGELGKGLAQGMEKGTKYSRYDVRSFAQEKVNRAVRDIEKLGTDLGTAIKGTPLEAKAGEIQGLINQHVTRMTNEVNRIYAEVTKGLQTVRQQTGAKGLVLRDPDKAPLQFGSGVTVGSSVDPGDRKAIEVARQSIAHSSGLSKSQQSKLLRVFKEVDDQIQAELQEAQRVLSEIRANRDPVGRPADPRGARRTEGGIYVDAGGREFIPSESGGLVPHERPEGFNVEREYRELVGEERMTNEELRRRKLRATEELERNAAIEKEAALEKRRIVARELEAQIASGEAVRGGNFVRDREGRIFKFSDAGEGAAEVRTPKDRLVAQQSIINAERRIQKQKEREAAAAARNAAAEERRALAGLKQQGMMMGGGGGGGYSGPARPGAQGFFDRAFGGQQRGLNASEVLSTGFNFTRYMISAAAFGAAFTVFNEIRQAVLDYEDSLVDLEIALNQGTKAQDSFTNSLAEVSRLAGENPGAALDVAARGIRAFADATAGLEEREAVGFDFAENTARLAVIAGKDLKDAGGDLTAVAVDFEVGFERIVDAVAFAKNELGGDPGEISQGMAALATAAREAGFNLEETAAIVARVSARTDSSGRSVGTRLARAFGIVGNTGRGALAQLNQQLPPELQVGLGGTPADTIKQLAEIYPQLSEQQQGMVRSQVGGTANTREFIALLSEMENILSATGGAYDTAGEGLDQFNRQQEELNKTLARIRGSLKNIVVELAEAGIFDIFVAGLKALDPFLFAVDQLLTLYNEMPRPLRTLVALTLEWAAAQKLLTMYLAARTGLTGIEASQMGVVGGFRYLRGARATGPAGIMDAERAGLYSTVRRSGAIPIPLSRPTLAGTAGALAGAGRFAAADLRSLSGLRDLPNTLRQLRVADTANAALAGLGRGLGRFRQMVLGLNPLLVALAGAFAIQQAYKATQEILDAQSAAHEAAQRFGQGGDMRAQADERLQAASELREASSGFFGSLSNLVQGRPVEALATDLEEQGARFGKVAEAVEEFRREAARAGSGAGAIDVSTPGGVEQGLKILQETGRSATDQIRALSQAVSSLARDAEGAAGRLSDLALVEFTNLLGVNIDTALGDLERDQRTISISPFGGGDAFADILEGRDGEQVVSSANRIAREYLQATRGQLDGEQLEELARLVMSGAVGPYVDMAELSEEKQQEVRNRVMEALLATKSALSNPEDRAAMIDEIVRAELSLIGGFVAEAKTLASLTGDSRGGALAGAEANVQELRRFRTQMRGSGATPEQLRQLDTKIREAELELQSALNARLDAELKLAQSLVAPTLDIERLDLQVDTLRQQLRNATDQDQIDQIEAQINDLLQERAQQVVQRVNAARLAGIDPRNETALAVAELQNARDALNQIVASGDQASKAFFNAVAAVNQAQQKVRDVQRGIIDAAGGVFGYAQDEIGSATVELRAAQRALAAALPGQQAWYEAYGQLLEAQASLARARAEFSQVRRISTIDITDPVAVADAEIGAIRDQMGAIRTVRGQIAHRLGELLRQPRTAANAEQIRAAQDALNSLDREALSLDNDLTRAVADAERALFDQRLGDFQTDLDLGRITRVEYIAALEQMLANVEGNTRQAKEMRDQIELALKAARDELDGQFNLGDIKLPTPFEVRRAIQAQTAGLTEEFRARDISRQAPTFQQTVSIQIDGADTAMVKKVLTEALGPSAFQTMTPGSSGTRRM